MESRLTLRAFPCMTPLERALDLSHAAFAILHQHGRFSGPQHQRVCEAILGDLRIARRQGVRGRTAVYGPVCTVVWEGEAVRPTPIPISAAVFTSCEDD